jgi:hypothetical protein
MNSEEEEVVGVDERRKDETDSPATPVIGGDAFPASTSPFKEDPLPFPKEREVEEEESAKPKAFLRKSTFSQSPIVEADLIDTPRLNPEHQRTGKNIVSVKDKHFTTFSPQPNATAYNNFASFAHTNEAAFIDADPHGDYFKSSSGKLAEITLPLLAG